jgi:hypothetical protein
MEGEKREGFSSDGPEIIEKRSRAPLIIAICAVALLAAVMAVYVLGLFGGGGGEEPEAKWMSAAWAEDGAAYIPAFDGTALRLENVEAAAQTADKKHVVALTNDGQIYMTDGELGEKTVIDDDGLGIFYVRDAGFIYYDNDYCFYRVSFTDGSVFRLGECDDVAAAVHTMEILYAKDGVVYSLPADSETAQEVGTYEDSIYIYLVSDDGQLGVWASGINDVDYIMLRDGGEGEKLFVTEREGEVFCKLSKDQQLLTVDSVDQNCFWLKQRGCAPVELQNEGWELKYTDYSPMGRVELTPADEISCIYFDVESDIDEYTDKYTTSLWCAGLTGETEPVLENIGDHRISDGRIAFIDADGGLYCAELDGAQLKNRTLIDAGAAAIEFEHEYLYYLKNVTGEYADETGDLYCYKLGDEKPVKIDEDVSCSVKFFPVSKTYNSEDGAQVWYFKNMQSLGENMESCAEMLTWSYGDEAPEKVDDNVSWYSVYSDIYYYLRPDGYVYLRYTGDYDENDSLFDMVYFDGKSSTVLAEGVFG